MNSGRRIPWDDVIEEPREYLELAALPRGFIFKHPKDYNMAEVSTLYLHLYNAQEGLSRPSIRFSWLPYRSSKNKRSHRDSRRGEYFDFVRSE